MNKSAVPHARRSRTKRGGFGTPCAMRFPKHASRPLPYRSVIQVCGLLKSGRFSGLLFNRFTKSIEKYGDFSPYFPIETEGHKSIFTVFHNAVTKDTRFMPCLCPQHYRAGYFSILAPTPDSSPPLPQSAPLSARSPRHPPGDSVSEERAYR